MATEETTRNERILLLWYLLKIYMFTHKDRWHLNQALKHARAVHTGLSMPVHMEGNLERAAGIRRMLKFVRESISDGN